MSGGSGGYGQQGFGQGGYSQNSQPGYGQQRFGGQRFGAPLGQTENYGPQNFGAQSGPDMGAFNQAFQMRGTPAPDVAGPAPTAAPGSLDPNFGFNGTPPAVDPSARGPMSQRGFVPRQNGFGQNGLEEYFRNGGQQY